MKKLIYTLLAVSLIFTACKKEEGCTDIIATNYNADAEDDDNSCIYSIIGTWTPNSALIDISQSVTVAGAVVDSYDTSYTTTPADTSWEFSNVVFTADGQMISDGDTNSYSHSGNVLTITEDGETETQTCTVTSTSLTVIMSDTEEETIEYMGQEGTSSFSYNMTLNATRQ